MPPACMSAPITTRGLPAFAASGTEAPEPTKAPAVKGSRVRPEAMAEKCRPSWR